jgi:hypothetical protein
MTEAEWLACTDPQRMLEFLRGRASDRKLRLFACACCRRIWHLLYDERSRGAIEVAERYVDGMANDEMWSTCQRLAADARDDGGGARAAWHALTTAEDYALRTAYAAARYPREQMVWALGVAVERSIQGSWLRDIIGNPFPPVSLDPSWLTSDVGALAQAAYEQRELPQGTLDPARLAVLADCLEEAGCRDDQVLGHLRGPGPHVRGCFVVDLLLGRG